jgi:hypothetical protein
MVTERPFVDYYEVLQLSPNAHFDTVERVYRLLAKRYHPDNQATGDAAIFAQVHQAYEVLADPTSRAAYDVQHDESRRREWQILDQLPAADGPEQDQRLFHRILSLLYIARRRDPNAGGLGGINLERLLGISQQDLEFALWYTRQRAWITVLDTGQYAITVDGIDKLGSNELALPANRLLAAASTVVQDSAPATSSATIVARSIHPEAPTGGPG